MRSDPIACHHIIMVTHTSYKSLTKTARFATVSVARETKVDNARWGPEVWNAAISERFGQLTEGLEHY